MYWAVIDTKGGFRSYSDDGGMMLRLRDRLVIEEANTLTANGLDAAEAADRAGKRFVLKVVEGGIDPYTK